MASIHQHLIAVSARLSIFVEVAHRHPSAVWIFAGLVIKIQKDKVVEQPVSGRRYLSASQALGQWISGQFISARLILILYSVIRLPKDARISSELMVLGYSSNIPRLY